MNQIDSILRRFAMTCLFIVALFMTYQSVSGVNVQTLKDFAQEKLQAAHQMDKKLKLTIIDFTKNKIAWVETFLTSGKASAETVPLEDSIDWTKYPKQTVIATGYTAGYESTGKSKSSPSYGITYSGVKVKRDLFSTIAADLTVFPIGTILFIPGYGYGVVADKGGAIKGNELDLYYETVHEVYHSWGKRKLDVYIVQKGNGKLTEQELTTLNEDKSMQVFRQAYIKSEQK